jgi:hypothetical protein
VRCFRPNSDQTQIDAWAGCLEPKVDDIASVNQSCFCTSQTALFTGRATLINIAVAPMSSGGTLSFFPGQKPPSFTPSIPSSATSSSIPISHASGSTTSLSDSTPSLATPTVSPSPFTDGTAADLPTGAKIGIGVGVAVGALLIFAMVFVAFLIRRRKKAADEQESKTSPQSDQTTSGSSWQASDNNTTSPSFSGFKAELAADGPSSGDASVSPMSPQHPQSPPQRQYEAYNPVTHGNYARYSTISELNDPHSDPSQGSAVLISPQHSGSSHEQRNGSSTVTGQLPMEPIWELQA